MVKICCKTCGKVKPAEEIKFHLGQPICKDCLKEGEEKA